MPFSYSQIQTNLNKNRKRKYHEASDENESSIYACEILTENGIELVEAYSAVRYCARFANTREPHKDNARGAAYAVICLYKAGLMKSSHSQKNNIRILLDNAHYCWDIADVLSKLLEHQILNQANFTELGDYGERANFIFKRIIGTARPNQSTFTELIFQCYHEKIAMLRRSHRKSFYYGKLQSGQQEKHDHPIDRLLEEYLKPKI